MQKLQRFVADLLQKQDKSTTRLLVLALFRGQPVVVSHDLLMGYKNLSKRECQVLALVAQGLKNGEVGAALGIAEQTAKSHLTSIMTKLNARDRTHAAVLALLHGFIYFEVATSIPLFVRVKSSSGEIAAILSPANSDLARFSLEMVVEEYTSLSERQCQVLALVAQGLKSGEVGAVLCISNRTANGHMSHIMTKLNARDRTHAVMKGLYFGFLYLQVEDNGVQR